MSSDTCGSDVAANSLYTSLVAGEDFSLPAVDLSGAEFQIPDYTADPLFADTTKLTEDDLTERKVRGSGMFDALMETAKVHLQEEFSNNRISAKEYAQLYHQLTSTMMSAALQYLLQKDQSYYQAALVQHQAQMAKIAVIQSRVDLERSKAELRAAQADAKTREAQFAHTKLMIASEDAKRCLTHKQGDQVQYEIDSLMPAQVDKLVQDTATGAAQENLTISEKARVDAQTINVTAEKEVIDNEAEIGDYRITNLLPKELESMTAQISKITADKDQVLYQTANILPEQLANLIADKNVKVYQHENVLPSQVANLTADTEGKDYTNEFILPQQYELAKENTEATRAKTLDTRLDGATVAGSIGKQKELHTQQIKSYEDDAKWKVAKGLLDTWITQKSLDDGLVAPTSLQDGSINSAMAGVRTSVGL